MCFQALHDAKDIVFFYNIVLFNFVINHAINSTIYITNNNMKIWRKNPPKGWAIDSSQGQK